MDFKNMPSRLTMKNQNLHYRLKIISGLFSSFMFWFLLYFGVKYEILNDEYISVSTPARWLSKNMNLI